LSPTKDEIAWAHKVIAAFDDLADSGESVGMLEGKVIDKYENDLAMRTLEWAADCAAKDAYKAKALSRAQAQTPIKE
jgi:citrate lyase beta subunit